jgi:negative regulator of sigma E activity
MSSEMLSAALDGECSAEELDQLLRQMEQSPELKEQWGRLCLARDIVAGAQLRLQEASLCPAVMHAIGDERPSSKVVPLLPRRPASVWRPLVGLATAAGVAGIAFVLGYRSPVVEPVGPAAVAAAQASQRPAALVATSVPVQQAKAVTVAEAAGPARHAPNAGASGWDSLEEGDARQLNNYLIDYSSYRAGAGMADTLGYARFAAHTAEYNPDR